MVLTVAALAATAWFLFRPRYRYVWGEGSALPEAVNVPGVEIYEPNFTPDGKALIYTHGSAGGTADLYEVAVDPKTGETAGEPRPLTSVNTPDYDEIDGHLGADGNLYFYSDRPGGFGGYDLYSAPLLPDGTYGPAINLGADVNSSEYDYDPCISANGRFLYFSSNRHDPGVETNFEILVSIRGDEGWSAPKSLPGVNSPANEWEPALSPEGRTLYFTSNREGSKGYDLYAASFTTNREWGAVMPLGDGVNTEHDELDPTVNPATGRLFFVRLERFTDGTQSVRIWNASLDAVPLGPILSLDEIPKRLVYLIASALAALLLLWLLYFLWGRLTTLQKCILVSLLLHCIAAWILSITSMKSDFDDLSRSDAAFSVYSDPTGELDPDSVLASLFSDTAASEALPDVQEGEEAAPPRAEIEEADVAPPLTQEAAEAEWQEPSEDEAAGEPAAPHAAFLPSAPPQEAIRVDEAHDDPPPSALPELASEPSETVPQSAVSLPSIPSANPMQAPDSALVLEVSETLEQVHSTHAPFVPKDVSFAATPVEDHANEEPSALTAPELAENTKELLPEAPSGVPEASYEAPRSEAQSFSVTLVEGEAAEAPASHSSFLPEAAQTESVAVSVEAGETTKATLITQAPPGLEPGTLADGALETRPPEVGSADPIPSTPGVPSFALGSPVELMDTATPGSPKAHSSFLPSSTPPAAGVAESIATTAPSASTPKAGPPSLAPRGSATEALASAALPASIAGELSKGLAGVPASGASSFAIGEPSEGSENAPGAKGAHSAFLPTKGGASPAVQIAAEGATDGQAKGLPSLGERTGEGVQALHPGVNSGDVEGVVGEALSAAHKSSAEGKIAFATTLPEAGTGLALTPATSSHKPFIQGGVSTNAVSSVSEGGGAVSPATPLIFASTGAGTYSFTVPDVGGIGLGGTIPTPSEPVTEEMASLSVKEAEDRRPPPHRLFFSHMPIASEVDIPQPKKHKFHPPKPTP